MIKVSSLLGGVSCSVVGLTLTMVAEESKVRPGAAGGASLPDAHDACRRGHILQAGIQQDDMLALRLCLIHLHSTQA